MFYEEANQSISCVELKCLCQWICLLYPSSTASPPLHPFTPVFAYTFIPSISEDLSALSNMPHHSSTEVFPPGYAHTLHVTRLLRSLCCNCLRCSQPALRMPEHFAQHDTLLFLQYIHLQ